MNDEPKKPGEEHRDRVGKSFDDFVQSLPQELPGAARQDLHELRDAIAAGRPEDARRQLASVRERHGWLYEELARHPALSTLFNELALWGF